MAGLLHGLGGVERNLALGALLASLEVHDARREVDSFSDDEDEDVAGNPIVVAIKSSDVGALTTAIAALGLEPAAKAARASGDSASVESSSFLGASEPIGSHTPLQWAVRSASDVAVVQTLCAMGAKVDARTPADRQSPLRLALDNPVLHDTTRYLIQEAGADCLLLDRAGRSCADIIVDRMLPTPFCWMMEHTRATAPDQWRAICNYRRGGSRGKTLMQLALEAKNQVFSTYVAEEVDPDVCCDDGSSCLVRAAAVGHETALQRLLMRGANANARGPNHEPADTDSTHTALHVACHKGRSAVVAFLLHCGADPALTNGAGRTPLQVATAECRAMIERHARAQIHLPRKIYNASISQVAQSPPPPPLPSSGKGEPLDLLRLASRSSRSFVTKGSAQRAEVCAPVGESKAAPPATATAAAAASRTIKRDGLHLSPTSTNPFVRVIDEARRMIDSLEGTSDALGSLLSGVQLRSRPPPELFAFVSDASNAMGDWQVAHERLLDVLRARVLSLPDTVRFAPEAKLLLAGQESTATFAPPSGHPTEPKPKPAPSASAPSVSPAATTPSS